MNASYSVVLDRGLNAPDALERVVVPAASLEEARQLLGTVISGGSPLFVSHGRRTDIVGVKEDHFILVTKGRFGTIKDMTRAQIVVSLSPAIDRAAKTNVRPGAVLFSGVEQNAPDLLVS
ncbi:hypothetical protein BKD30_03100 [Tersicoccus phoenicis]|uniref:Uncharacterized protein n=1 Tax=Tersicoccus phoenicis TaxID=554083 RepID=A0A1R1LJD6_9MICC|nr:hypothetical protein [Tersicoccus phoenicis]OMH27648.1 hypothetical protein BKD30_03100 [Tersicoccus phoenicis]